MSGRRFLRPLLAAALLAPGTALGAQDPTPTPAGDSVVLAVELPPPLLVWLPPLRVAPTPVVLRRAEAVDPAAQPEQRPAVRTWKRSVELAGNLFFGSRPQTVLTTRGRTSHADSTFEFAADVRFAYGESDRDGEREVSQRLWQATTTLDLWPFASQSPFLLGGVESSLERRIQLRVTGGVGHKMTFVDDERALANVSVAVLGEQSRLPTAEGLVEVESLTRLSTRLRLRRRIGTRTELSHELFYRPELAQLTSYTLSNSASASYRVSEALNLKASYLDNYDSEARGRGARSNYDGQLVLGMAADF